MQDRWANLLANAADPRAEALPPSLPKVLADMSSREAKFLDVIYNCLSESGRTLKVHEIEFSKPFERSQLFDLYMKSGCFSAEGFSIDMDSLLSG